MLADELDYVVGVDPHRDTHALAIVHAVTGAALFGAQVAANKSGYAQAVCLAEREAPGRRAWAIEGTGSYGAGLARFLSARGERVLEVGRTRRERRSHGKTDALDALQAARCVLGKAQLASPRAGGEREALRALMVARAGAIAAKKAGLCQLRALLVTCPEPLRGELRSLSGRACSAAWRRCDRTGTWMRSCAGRSSRCARSPAACRRSRPRNASSNARSRHWSRDSRRRCSSKRASARSRPRKC
jgi:hypothetical protein